MLIWDARGIVREFIAALRQLRHPLVRLAVSVLLLQSVVTGLASGTVAAQIATFGADAAVICHGNGDDSSVPAPAAAHGCCVFCTASGPVVLSAAVPVIDRLKPARYIGQAESPGDGHVMQRAVRAGPSQAPPASV
jgi:hypothetical protein